MESLGDNSHGDRSTMVDLVTHDSEDQEVTTDGDLVEDGLPKTVVNGDHRDNGDRGHKDNGDRVYKDNGDRVYKDNGDGRDRSGDKDHRGNGDNKDHSGDKDKEMLKTDGDLVVGSHLKTVDNGDHNRDRLQGQEQMSRNVGVSEK